jgi:hypothetical protein
MPAGVRRSTRKRAGGRKSRPADSEPLVPAPAPLSDFLSAEPIALDAAKWPVHPAIWWQPDLPLQLPVSSGLHAERRFKIPVADFRKAGASLECRPPTRAAAAEALAPLWNDALPASDLVPLGWDPRTCLPQRGNQGRIGPEGGDL